jgi:hypothetical protein
LAPLILLAPKFSSNPLLYSLIDYFAIINNYPILYLICLFISNYLKTFSETPSVMGTASDSQVGEEECIQSFGWKSEEKMV